ncbi:MAG: type I glutamate--ammonia ligase [Dehalococcoidia bacterium]
MTPHEVSDFIKQKGIKIVDLKFNDLPGLWQHFSIPVAEMTELEDLTKSIWVEGIGFDGSSIRGFQQINESDMILIPDPKTAVQDPITAHPTLSLICDIYDPITRQPYTRDPRYIARKAEEYLKTTGIADTSYWGPECEFFVFDDVRFDVTENSSYYFVDSVEADWNTGRMEEDGGKRGNLGYKARYKEGYFPTAPFDTLQDIRTEMILEMEKAGITVEVHHHEVATAGQCEIDVKFDTLVKMADSVMMYKYIVKNVARRHGKVASFMPKPIFNDNGSGMHTHQSLWKNGENIMYDAQGYALTSQECRWYIGGLLKHARALMGFCAPTTNSYKRLVPGFEAPVNLVYSARNRSAACRIPVYTDSPKSKRIEFRSPDPMANPYLAFAACLMAGLDGIENQIDPGPPLDRNTYELSAAESLNVRTLPGSLEEALQALEDDHDFMLRGNVFTPDVIDIWLQYKREREIDELRLRPHPYEYYMYFDA